MSPWEEAPAGVRSDTAPLVANPDRPVGMVRLTEEMVALCACAEPLPSTHLSHCSHREGDCRRTEQGLWEVVLSIEKVAEWDTGPRRVDVLG
jgi:hypothetical protein